MCDEAATNKEWVASQHQPLAGPWEMLGHLAWRERIAASLELWLG